MNEQIKKIMELNSQRMASREAYSELLNPTNRDLESQLRIARQTLLTTVASQLKVVNESNARLQQTKAAKEQELYRNNFV